MFRSLIHDVLAVLLVLVCGFNKYYVNSIYNYTAVR